MASLYRMDIRNLKGVGEKRAAFFQKLGVTTVGALLRFYPRSYEDLSHPCEIAGAPAGQPCAVRAQVVRRPAGTRIRGGMTLYKGLAYDGSSSFTLTFFNNPYVVSMLREGEDYIFYGRVTANFLRREMVAPEFYPAGSCPAVRPVYRQTKGLSSRVIAGTVREALLLLPEPMKDPIPESLRSRYSLCPLRFAMENVHFPGSMEAAETARRRLIFEEFLILQLGLFLLKGKNRPPSRFRLQQDYTEDFFSLLPFSPTRAQRRAVREAMTDLTGGSCMNRLIQGDVGSGKTAVAAALCYSVVKNGFQAALMAPTEILARQHFGVLSRLLEPAGIRVALLTGSIPAARRKKILSGMEDGTVGLTVGTHALFSKDVRFCRLGLVVTDEQHRFGVAQRAALSAKGTHPHLLVMSATPIPRTLALMIYGDLDLSVLDELPPGRREIKTYAVTSDKRGRVFSFLKKRLAEGRQCYIVCPAIEEGEGGVASVERYAEKLRSEWLRGFPVEVLHGRMKARDKEDVMHQFSSGEIGVLVSTTVVEVGVDVPNATVMVVENAERYGLSQLHQLRGRVGRGRHQSYCILISDVRSREALARLRIMCQTSDGFRIADEDLRLRGPGDFFGQRQHGLPSLKIADMTTDMEVMRQAQAAARSILEDDPALTLPEHRGMRAEVKQLFQNMED
ncbi:MAG: ATP-dependent DNA helicase RecG [Oscillospiraceae bacterium]|nr:ATP-dependent DNA helicase RecG [Oscillospiraceae bacterium]